MADRQCLIETCDRAMTAPTGRGMCGYHYLKWRRHGDPLADVTRTRNVGVTACSVEGCEALVKARGWCGKHYHRWERHGDPVARLRGEVVDGKRVCSRCGIDQPVENFYKTSGCRSCVNEDMRPRNHQRRAARVGAAAEAFPVVEIFDRDGWTCQLCGLSLCLVVKWPHPLYPTIDHIRPISLGGAHTRANTQAAHSFCNGSKLNRWTEEEVA